MTAGLLSPGTSLLDASTPSHTLPSVCMSYTDTSHKVRGPVTTASLNNLLEVSISTPKVPVSPLRHRTLERAQFGPEHPVMSSSEYTGRGCQNAPNLTRMSGLVRLDSKGEDP